ncbi:MAG: aminotransferase class IV [Longimicrobiales bacterium]
MIACVDGRWVEADHAAIPITDRGFLFGHAVFETIRMLDARLFRLSDHLARLHAGAAAVGVPVPDADRLRALARELVRRNDVADAVLRITATTGSSDEAPRLILQLEPMPADWDERVRRGWRLITASVRHPPPAVSPPHIKTPGRLHAILARREARAAGADDALLLDLDDHVTEGPSWNVFWSDGATLHTPATDLGVLPGVTRATVLEVATSLSVPVRQGVYPRGALDGASELFVTMTSLGPVPVRSLDGRAFTGGDAPIFEAVREAYWTRARRDGE